MVKAVACLSALLTACSGIGEPGALVPPTADQDSRLPQVTLSVAGHRRAIHVETFGDPASPPLLLLHGSLSDYRAWLPFRALASDYFVVMWDRRGNGLSERIGAAEFSFDSVVEEIEAMRQEFVPGRPVTLIGHSFGAMFSVLYSSRFPERVSATVLVEPAGLNAQIFNETFDDIFGFSLWDPQMSATFWQNEVLSPSTHESMDYKSLLLLENGHQTQYHCDPDHPPHWPVWRPGAYVEYLRGRRLGFGAFGGEATHDFTAGLDQFDGPVLLVGTECSALGYDFQREHHEGLFRDVRVAEIDDAGHRVMAERPEELLRIVREFLDGRVAP